MKIIPKEDGFLTYVIENPNDVDIMLQTIHDSKHHKYNDHIKYICNNCKKEVIITYVQKARIRKLDSACRRMLCHNCAIANTNFKHYGYKTNLISPDQIEKTKQKMLDKFGVEYALQSLKIREKGKLTKIARYDNPNYTNEEKRKLTFKNNYGNENPFKTTNFKIKTKLKMLDKFGVEYYVQTNDFKIKSKQTNLNRLGVENSMQNEYVKEKAKLTKINRYDDPNYNNRPLAESTCKIRYGIAKVLGYDTLYFAISFGSSLELAVWIYCKDHGIRIIQTPTVLKYIGPDNELHRYYPDFYIEGIGYVEIKGDQFWDKDNPNKMISPYKRDSKGNTLSSAELKSRNELYEAKHQFGLHVGVKFWKTADCMFAVDYVNKFYGINYLDSFKTGNALNPSYEYFNGFSNLRYPRIMMPIYYTPLSINNQITVLNKIDSEGYIMSENSKGVTPYDLGYTATHKYLI